MRSLFEKHDAVIVFDTETSGLDPNTDQIIELAAVRLRPGDDGAATVDNQLDLFIRLPEGAHLPQEIIDLTHITDEMIASEGVDSQEAAERFCTLIGEGRTILAAHNAQFDLSFIRRLLSGKNINKPDFLDTLTVYKDRRAYPHRLENAINEYKLTEKVQNSHRAIDDVLALVEVMRAMSDERDDLKEYLNVFGYNPKYGPPSQRIRGIRYHAQPFHVGIVDPKFILPRKEINND